MKLLPLLLLALASVLLHPSPASAKPKDETCGRCEGGQCNVCSDCSRCRHCKAGGTCSVCARGSDSDFPNNFAAGNRTTIRRSRSITNSDIGMGQQEATREPSWIRQQRLERAQAQRFQSSSRQSPPLSASSGPLTGKCIAVVDGDTLKMLVSRTTTTIRLNGIDAPEKAQAFGTQSKTSLSLLCFGKTITVYPKSRDRYGRTLGWVFVGKTAVNSEQVKRGMAWWYKQYAPTEAKIAAVESSARAAHIGLWRDANPIAPWNFRSSKRRA